MKETRKRYVLTLEKLEVSLVSRTNKKNQFLGNKRTSTNL